MESQITSSSGGSENHMYKTRLQEYTQKACIALPRYETINEGSQHAPKFRSSVTVDGDKYTSPLTFSRQKEAEQDVAKVALDHINQTIKQGGVPIIREDTKFCKSILNEYAVKMKTQMPVYSFSVSQDILPIFTSHVCFDGKTYQGEPRRSKKEAEQMAACVAIESILGNSESRTVMLNIIRSKGKLFYALSQRGLGSELQAVCPSPELSIGEATNSSSANRKNKRKLYCIGETNQENMPLLKQLVGTRTG